MREPTSQREAFAWYRQYLFGDERPSIDMNEPQCGYYAVRAVRGGVLVPARIYIEQDIDENGELADDERLVCEFNGRMVDPYEYWVRLCDSPVPFAKHEYHKHLNAHAGWHDLDVPEARTNKPIDWMRVEPPVFRDD